MKNIEYNKLDVIVGSSKKEIERGDQILWDVQG